MQHHVDIHQRPTRILRSQRDTDDERETIVCEPRTSCFGCSSSLVGAPQFCGACGVRVRARISRVGTLVDGLYQVEHELASGSIATIYRARYLPSGREVALKVLHAELALDPIVAERFRREARCLGRLRDIHTVAVLDHGETDDGIAYIAMELVAGEGLDVRIRTRGAMPWREVLTILRAVCTSLAEAHSHGIVHRDLKPANIRIGPNGVVKVIDFGLAKLRPADGDEDLTYGGQAVGTLQYMAPEQLVGCACDGRADLYALGIIGHELLLGRMRAPGAAVLPLPADIPRGVAQLLARCVVTDPAARFASALELLAFIDHLLAPRASSPATPARRVYPHTSAFEQQPPRIVVDEAPQPAFVAARGSQPDLVESPAVRPRWKVWALGIVICGVGFGTAMAGCV